MQEMQTWSVNSLCRTWRGPGRPWSSLDS